ncbi:tyrosine-protein phosphatase 10D-like [Physella acuta]|uniref:tyrosine-protein phosphatase 10D-like n=1 Tax=Physella acuta TaxID=109671 RepID=UPI0027DBA682|nr:tyrosine-protein phosphatase 10D-like [Physella acuta]
MSFHISTFHRQHSQVIFYLFFIVLVPPLPASGADNFRLSTTEYTITLSFRPDTSATNYTASFRLSNGFTYNYRWALPPFSNIPVSIMFDGGLPGQRYTVELAEELSSSPSKTVFAQETATIPLSPVNVTVQDRGSNYLILTWATVNDLLNQGFVISYRKENDARQSINTSSVLTFNLTGLNAGYSYEVSIEAVTLDKRSNPSDTILATTLPLPPTNLVASEDSSNMTISWSPQTGSYQDFYQVKYSVNGSSPLVTTHCTDPPCSFAPGPPSGVTVSIFVYSVSHNFTSVPVRMEHSTAPGIVSNLRAVEGVRSLNLSWTAPSNSVQVNYSLILTSLSNSPESKVSTFVVPAVGNLVVKQLDSLYGGNLYEVKVRAVARYSIGAATTENFRTVPEPVTNLTGMALNTTAILLSWIPPTRSYIGFTNITVYSPGAQPYVVEENREFVKSRELTDLIPGQQYNVSLSVYSPYSFKPSSEVFGFFRTKPVKPRIVSVGVEERSINLTLARLNDQGVFTSIQASLSVGESQIVNAARNMIFSSLIPGTHYKLDAYVLSGQESSEHIYADLYTKPRPPQNVYVSTDGEDKVFVEWDGPDEGGFDNFTVTIFDVDNADNAWSLVTTDLFAEFDRLLPGSTYNVSVSTIKGDQISREVWDSNTTKLLKLIKRNRFFNHLSKLLKQNMNFNAISHYRTKRADSGAPLAVENLNVASLNTTALFLSWSVSSSSNQTSFDIYANKNYLVNATKQLNYNLTMSDLTPGTSYSVSVVAVKEEARSSPKSVQGLTAPNPVTNLNIELSSPTSLQVTWIRPSAGRSDSFNISYKSLNSSSMNNTSTTSTSKTISGLFPGYTYEFNVTAVSNGVQSQEVTKVYALSPLPPENVSKVKGETNETNVKITWQHDATKTYCEKWEITWLTYSQTVNTTQDKTYTSTVGQLVAGKTYTVTVVSVVGNKRSNNVQLKVTTKPLMTSKLTEVSSTNSSIRFNYTVVSGDTFDNLTFSLKDGNNVDNVDNVSPVTRTKSDPKDVEFSGLTAGTKYTVSAVTNSNDETSSPKILQILTNPNAVPVNLYPYSQSVTLELGPQLGDAANYIITCMDSNNQSCKEKKVQRSQNLKFNETISDLKPYQDYMFTVETQTETLDGHYKNVTKMYSIRTLQAAPGPVVSLNASEPVFRTVKLTWKPPVEANGNITKYMISYTKDNDKQEEIFSTESLMTEFTIANLTPGVSYTFKVSAFTVEKGNETEIKYETKTQAPVFKESLTLESSKPELAPEDQRPVTENQLKLLFINPFSDANGKVIEYSVIVSTEPSPEHDTNDDLPSWGQAREDSTIKVYKAINRCKDFFSSTSSCGTARRKKRETDNTGHLFVVGAELNCEGKKFCNGQLSENTGYYIKLRGYTKHGHNDTAYSDMIKTAESQSNSVASTIGGVIGAFIILILIAVAVILFLKWRNRPKKASKHSAPKSSWEHNALAKLSRPVKLSDFPFHVKKMESDSDFKYAEEYEDLKEVGRDQPCTAAEFPPNRPKNRFTNILPYDHSRVKLLPTDDEEGSDYINANYMPGYNSKREYIATQGPLPSTRDDFWRMIWEQNCRNIVMLTRCQEKGREKSDHYWPNDSEAKFYGDLQVVILNETHMPDWTVTELKVSLGEQSRNIRHFYYRVWPDFGVPKNPTSLIRFVRTVRDKLIREGGPIVTHCSAGVGRSGTFIVLDHVLQLIREKDEVDIFSLVYKLRKERVLMVQTEQQYKFIHECLLCVLEGREEDTTYANVGEVNPGFEDEDTDFGINMDGDDEGINVELN